MRFTKQKHHGPFATGTDALICYIAVENPNPKTPIGDPWDFGADPDPTPDSTPFCVICVTHPRALTSFGDPDPHPDPNLDPYVLGLPDPHPDP